MRKIMAAIACLVTILICGMVFSGMALAITGEKGLILWNKLGSDAEVTHSEAGPNGEIIGSVNFEPGQFGSGFRSAPRAGDLNIPDNFILFRDLNLGHKGCIELWYQPNWNNPSVGHVIDLFNYGNPAHGPSLNAQYNDWQDRWLGSAFDYSYQQVVSKYLTPSQTPGWSTTEPFHLAYVWDDSLSDPVQRMRIFVNGVDVGILNGYSPSDPKFDNWGTDFVLYLGCRMTPGDYYRHPWETNVDGVIDNIKIWNYAKTDFSDRFIEGVPDTTPPVIKVGLNPDTLWPPNNKMVGITATVNASDTFDPAPRVALKSITCNEPMNPGDIKIADLGTAGYAFSLMATRLGSGIGRVYTVTYTATDASGNIASGTATVTVPHDQGKK